MFTFFLYLCICFTIYCICIYFFYTSSVCKTLWSYYLLIIVRLKGGSFLFLSCWSSPMFGCFITCMVAHFPAVDFDSTICFSTLSRMSGFLWHCSKWACWFGPFLQNSSAIAVSACNLDTDPNYVTTMLQLRPSLNH